MTKTIKPKTPAKKKPTDGAIRRQLRSANRQLEAMKNRKAAKARRKLEDRIINLNVRSTFEMIDDLSRVLVIHGDDKL